MIQIIQKQEVKTKTWKFLPINVVGRWYTQAVWWGCIAPYSHCVSTGRGKIKGRVGEIIYQKYYAFVFDSYFRNPDHGGELWTNLTWPCCSRRICMCYSPRMYRLNKMYSYIQIRRPLQTLTSGCVCGIFVGRWYLHLHPAAGMMAYLPYGLL